MTQELNRFPSRTALLLLLSLVLIGLYGCEPFTPHEQEALSRAPNRIVVLTTAGPLTYQRDSNGQSWGIDAELLNQFASRYSMELKFKTYNTQEEVIAAFSRGEGDVAAARLPTLTHGEDTLSGPSIEESHLSLFCLKKLNIENIRDLSERTLRVRFKDLTPTLRKTLETPSKGLQFQTTTHSSTRQLMMAVAQGQADCSVLEDLEGSTLAQTFLMIEKVADLTEDQPISWWVRAKHRELVTLMHIWFHRASRSDHIMRVMDRYHLKARGLDDNDVRRFYQNLRSTFPKFVKLFKKAGLEYGVPWQMIAAVAYQESHWDPEAKSYTGVKGLMQITQETADHLGLTDREDPTESIFGGAKYLKDLYAMTPSSLDSKERWALTLASYNVGYAHLKDAQKLAVQKGLDSTSWRDLKKVLPLLADPSYYESLEFGFARGHETVAHVDRTIAFYKLLALQGK
jgi:membrane-bound lytic murein transglycosylase F